MFCKKCGSEVSNTAKFCRSCGAGLGSLDIVAPTPVAPTPVAPTPVAPAPVAPAPVAPAPVAPAPVAPAPVAPAPVAPTPVAPTPVATSSLKDEQSVSEYEVEKELDAIAKHPIISNTTNKKLNQDFLIPESFKTSSSSDATKPIDQEKQKNPNVLKFWCWG
jgi:hypothetical protein